MFNVAVFLCVTVYIIYKFLKIVRAEKKVDRINERYVLITGCDSGFGKELCTRLDELGCKVFAGCFGEQGVTEIREDLSDNVKPFQLDVTQEASVNDFRNFVLENLPKGKGLWAIVNNAGVAGVFAPLPWLNHEHYSSVMETNFMGPVRVLLTMLPLLKPVNVSETPRVVNMTSILSTHPIPLSSPYSTSKAALQSLSQILRVELKDFGIRVVTMQPGLHNTAFSLHLKSNFKKCWVDMHDSVKDVYGEKYYKKAYDTVNRYSSLLSGKDLKKVTEAYLSALFDENPRDTYIIGKDSALLRLGYCLFGSCLWKIAAWLGLFCKPQKNLCVL